MFKTKWMAVALGALLIAGAAQAADKKVIAVSIPAADHGWTAGVVYHAQAAAKEINKAYKDQVEVIVKTSLQPRPRSALWKISPPAGSCPPW